MKVKHPKKNDKDKPRALKQEESITVKEDIAEITKNERTIFQIPGFTAVYCVDQTKNCCKCDFFLLHYLDDFDFCRGLGNFRCPAFNWLYLTFYSYDQIIYYEETII